MDKNLILFIAIAVLILGGVYYYSTLSEQESVSMEQTTEDSSVAAIEEDLEKTEIDNLDEEFVAIEAELEAALTESQ